MTSSARPSTHRLIWGVLLLIAFAGSLPRLWLAVHQPIDYDGWMHIFIGRQSSRWLFMREILSKPHPPLFKALLRVACYFGTSHLAYRAVSLAAGIASIVAAGRVAFRITSNAVLSALCAAGFAFSMSAIVLSNEVREYALLIFLVLVAFRFFVDLASLEPSPRALAGFSLAAALSIGSHYSAIFFLVATAAVPFLIAAFDAGYRTRLIEVLRRHPLAAAATFALPAGVFALGYAVQIRHWREPMNHLPEFYWNREVESLGSFLTRSVQNVYNLFSPLPLSSSRFAVPLAIVCVGAFFALLVAAIRLARQGDFRRAFAPAMAVVIAAQLAVAAAAGRYPFGGAMRHQSILFPFLLLSLIAGLDLAAHRLRGRQRALVYIVVAAAIATNLIAEWRGVVPAGPEPGMREVAAFRKVLPGSRFVYADNYSALLFFIQHDELRWKLEELPYPGDSWVQTYVIGEGERAIHVIRAEDQWQVDPISPKVYGRLREALDHSGRDSIALFQVRQLPPGPKAPDAAMITRLAAAQGMRVARLEIGESTLFAEFKRQGL